MDMREQPHWSYSAMNCFLQCPMKYAFRYIEKAPAERTGVCFPFGRAFHAVLSERAVKGSSYELGDALDDFAIYFQGEIDICENPVYKDGETFDSCLQKGMDMLGVALENWQDDFTVKSTAEPFTVTVPGLSKPLVGEFDLVVTDGGDETIVDWKTSAAKWPVGKADRELQATAYSYAYKQLHGVIPLFRYDVITKAKQPGVSSNYTTRTEDDLKRFEWLARKIEHAVDSKMFYPNESSINCPECPYREQCRRKHRAGGC